MVVAYQLECEDEAGRPHVVFARKKTMLPQLFGKNVIPERLTTRFNLADGSNLDYRDAASFIVVATGKILTVKPENYHNEI